jgi:AcrR family transcriptional regulator
MRQPQPRRHHHLSQRTIAEAGLAIIDAHGPRALKLRDVATALGVGTMSLYTYVESRDALISNIVGLLLNEVDVSPVPDETWDASLWRVAHSMYEMVCRHPKAFELIALAPNDEPPILDYIQAIDQLHDAQGIPRERFVAMWGVVDPFITGFLLQAAQEMTRTRPVHPTYEASQGLAAEIPKTLTSETFGTALKVVICGLRQTVMREQSDSSFNPDGSTTASTKA